MKNKKSPGEDSSAGNLTAFSKYVGPRNFSQRLGNLYCTVPNKGKTVCAKHRLIDITARLFATFLLTNGVFVEEKVVLTRSSH